MKVMTIVVGIADIGFGALFDEGADFSLYVHLIDTIELVATLVVLKTDGMGIFTPFRSREGVLVGYQVGRRLNSLPVATSKI